jgi:serine/threonine-protein kinase
MGSVYLGRDERLGRRVAIKFLHELGADATARLHREARAAARLNHPNIGSIHDIATQDGVTFLVLEYVAGEPLSRLLEHGPLPVAQALDIAKQLAGALDYAHGQGVIHRDIKPANVIVMSDGRAKLLDLGIAHLSAVSTSSATTAAAGAPETTPGWKGTLPYMAPEQLAGGAVDRRSDIYSTGVLLFEALTGRRPFEAPDPMSLVAAIAAGDAPQAAAVRAEIPQPVSNAVARAMARNPDARPQSAAELRAVLERAQTGDVTRTEDTPAVVRRRRYAALLLPGVVALLAATLSFLAWQRPRPEPVPPGSILILPPLNLSGDSETEHVAAGLVSVLSDNLAAAPGVAVIPAAAAAAYRGQARDVRKAALELGARYVVDIAVAGLGDGEIRVRGRVSSPLTPTELWTAEYAADTFKVQRDLSHDLARALERRGLFSRALTTAERARMAQLPTEVPAAFDAYSQGIVALSGADDPRKAEAAVAAFERAIELDPGFALAHAGLARALGLSYRSSPEAAFVERAEAAARRALELDPERPQVHLSMASAYQTVGRLEDAARHAQQALRIAPANDDGHRLLGNILVDQGKAVGLDSLRRAAELRPEYWLNHFDLGVACYMLGRYREAVAPLTRTTELRPDFAGGYQALGTVHHVLGDNDRAIGNYQHALRLAPEAAAYSNLGFAYYTDGRIEEALAMWRKAVEQDPTSPATHRNLGDAYARLGRHADARAAYDEAIRRATTMLQVNPRDARRIALIALCEAKLGRTDAAMRHAAEAATLAPENSDVAYKTATVHALLGRTDRALEALKRAITLGYPPLFIAADDDLKSLRNHTDFKALLNPSAKPAR